MVITGNGVVLNLVNQVLCRIDTEPAKEVRVGWLHCLNTLLDKGNIQASGEDARKATECTTNEIQHFASQNRISLYFNEHCEPTEQNISIPSMSHCKQSPQFAHSPVGSSSSVCNYTHMPPYKRVIPVPKFSRYHYFEFKYEPQERKCIERDWLCSWRELRLGYLEQRDNLILSQTIVPIQQADISEAEMVDRRDLSLSYQHGFEGILLLEHEHRARANIIFEELLCLVLIAKSVETTDIQDFVYEQAHLCFHCALLHTGFAPGENLGWGT